MRIVDTGKFMVMTPAQIHAAECLRAINDALLEWVIAGVPTVNTRLRVGRSARKLREALAAEQVQPSQTLR